MTLLDLPDRLMELFLRLPQDRPFTTAYARDQGARWTDLRRMVDEGLLRHPVKGLYSSAQLPDVKGLRATTPLRTACDLGRLLHRDQALAVVGRRPAEA